MSQLFVRTGIHFSSSRQALEHIGEEMLARGVVHDSGEIDVSLIIALIVENPTAQLQLLRRLFSELQNPNTLEALLAASQEQLPELFRHSILESEPSAQAL